MGKQLGMLNLGVESSLASSLSVFLLDMRSKLLVKPMFALLQY